MFLFVVFFACLTQVSPQCLPDLAMQGTISGFIGYFPMNRRNGFVEKLLDELTRAGCFVLIIFPVLRSRKQAVLIMSSQPDVTYQ